MIEWDEDSIGHQVLFLPLFEREVAFEFFPDETPPRLTPTMARAVAQVQSLPRECIGTVAKLLWEEAVFSFTVTDYGVEALAGETPLAAHLRHFELSTPRDALDRSRVRAVQIAQENDARDHAYAEIQIETVTDSLMSRIVRDGVIVDFDDDGCWIGGFDANPHAAHDARAKTLAPQG